MNRIEESFHDMRVLLANLMRDGESEAEILSSLLVDAIHFCSKSPGVSFERCLKVARSEAAREAQEAALEAPLPY